MESLIPPQSDDDGTPGALVPSSDDGSGAVQDDTGFNADMHADSFRPDHELGAEAQVPLIGGDPRNVSSRPMPPAVPARGNSSGRYQGSAVFQIEVDKISPNPNQPRKHFDEAALKELAASIREFGVLQPLIVSKIDKETEEGSDVEYQLIAGERRLMAAKLAGLERVPAIVRLMGQKREQLELAIIENIQRENLSPVETARAFSRLQDEFGLTQREIATRLGKSRESVANTIRLLNLPTQIQKALEEGAISESQGRLLLGVSDMKEQLRLFNDIAKNSLSVRELKAKIKKNSAGVMAATPQQSEDDWIDSEDSEALHVKEQLELFFGAPVKIEKKGASGKIVIAYYSPEELEGILLRLRGKATDTGFYGDEHEEREEESDEFVV